MPSRRTFGYWPLIALTTLPALAIGMTLWVVSDLVPACAVVEGQRLTAPDSSFDLVTFSRSCGPETPANTQAVLVPVGDLVPYDAASFVSVAAAVDLAPAWTSPKALSIKLPSEGVLRSDAEVAGVAVTYGP